MTQDKTRPDPPFKQRMDERLARWYRGKAPHEDPEKQKRRGFLALLVNKRVMTDYIRGLGLPLPETYAEVASLDDLDLAALPDRVVIKPDNNASSKGVVLFDGETDLMTGARVPRSERGSYLRRLYAEQEIFAKPKTRVLAEEFLQDYDPAFAIPRDFKVFVGGGKAQVVQVIDRNPPKPLRTNSFFRRDWSWIKEQVKVNFKPGPAYDAPPHLEEMLRMADRIAQDIEVFYRLDFYMTTRGPVFGEFTSYPSAGLGFTIFGERLMCDIMGTWPEPI